MGNFGRVLKMALRQRVTLVASVVCALVVAVLWGGNIGAVYPVLQVALRGESLQAWADKELKASAERVQNWQAELEKAPDTKRAALQAQIDADEQTAGWIRFAKPWIDDYVPTQPFATLALILALIIVSTVVKDLFVIANAVLVARMAERVTFDLRKDFFRRTLSMDMATFTDEGTSDLMSRFTHDTANVANGLASLFGRMVREPLKGIACLIGAAWICWPLLVFTLLLAPPAALAIRWLAKTLKRANRRAMEEMAVVYGALEETFRGIKVVKAFTMERHERWHFHLAAKSYFKKAMKIASYDALAHPITEVMGLLITSIGALAGAWLVLQNETHLFGIPMCKQPLSLAALFVFFGLLVGAADPARKLSEVLSRIQQASAAADRIFALLDREPKVKDPASPQPLPRHRQRLDFEGVEFAYQPGRPILRGVNLEIGFGETIAIVGPNGSGKSTLANLIPRFADPTAGAVRLDGIALPDVRLADLRRQIGLVTQETVLFDDTVFNNIRYGSPNATREDVVAAAKKAHAHGFIEAELPNGYETQVGQLGGRLSGGQRQRIALARAILRDPAILILDEATSQIDLESEQIIHDVLQSFIADRTTVIITHRLSILSLATRIVVMDGGQIVAQGQHAELLAGCPLYARLHQANSAQA